MRHINILAPYQTSFTIKTNCNNLINSLILEHGKYAKSCTGTTNCCITAIKNDAAYTISFKNETFVTDTPLKKIKDIMYENRTYNENIFAIHGGAVAYNNKAYLIVASTTSGKTTLTSYLTSNGLGYITDDCILVDKNDFNVYPFNTPIHLRGGGYNVLKKLGVVSDELQLLDDISIKRYVYTPKKCITHSLPIEKIFFINRTENRNNTAIMNTTEKITSLLKSPITNFKMDADYLLFISELSKIPCEKLYYRDMDFVLEVIKNGQ